MRTVERFRPEHLELLLSQGVHDAQVTQVSPLVMRHADYLADAGVALTAFEGTQVIACTGVITGGSPYGTIWAMVGAEARHHRIWLHKAVLRYLDAVMVLKRLRRLEATVEEGQSLSARWLELLGFEFEGRMRNYGENGETHLRYARVRDTA